MRMSPTVDKLIERYGMPVGFRRTSWAAVYAGQQVWIYGTFRNPNDHDNLNGRAYGPHTIDDLSQRRLRNCKGKSFLEYQESLLVKDEPLPEPAFERWVENSRECDAAVAAATKGSKDDAVGCLIEAEEYADNTDFPERDLAFRQAAAYVEYKFGASYAELKRELGYDTDYGREDSDSAG